MNDEITMEWLQSIGFKDRFYHFDDDFFLYYGNQGGTYHVSLCCEVIDHECSHELTSRQFTTQAEVLRLVSLLARNTNKWTTSNTPSNVVVRSPLPPQ